MSLRLRCRGLLPIEQTRGRRNRGRIDAFLCRRQVHLAHITGLPGRFLGFRRFAHGPIRKLILGRSLGGAPLAIERCVRRLGHGAARTGRRSVGIRSLGSRSRIVPLVLLWRRLARLIQNHGSATVVGIGSIGRQGGNLGGLGERLVIRIEQALKVGGGDGVACLGVLIGINEGMGQPVCGRSLRHGGKRGAPIVGGPLIVAAGLLVTGGHREDAGVAREALERLTQPDLGLRLVIGRQGRSYGSLEVSRGCILHGNGLVKRQRLFGATGP